MKSKSPSGLFSSQKPPKKDDAKTESALESHALKRPLDTSRNSSSILPIKVNSVTKLKDHINKKGAVTKLPTKSAAIKATRLKSEVDVLENLSSFETIKSEEVDKIVMTNHAINDGENVFTQVGKIPRALTTEDEVVGETPAPTRRSTRVRIPTKKLKVIEELNSEEFQMEVEPFDEDVLDVPLVPLVPPVPKSHCPPADDYANAIFVYACLKNPERVAGYISTWED